MSAAPVVMSKNGSRNGANWDVFGKRSVDYELIDADCCHRGGTVFVRIMIKHKTAALDLF